MRLQSLLSRLSLPPPPPHRLSVSEDTVIHSLRQTTVSLVHVHVRQTFLFDAAPKGTVSERKQKNDFEHRLVDKRYSSLSSEVRRHAV